MSGSFQPLSWTLWVGKQISSETWDRTKDQVINLSSLHSKLLRVSHLLYRWAISELRKFNVFADYTLL